jgi:hypothetical protein
MSNDGEGLGMADAHIRVDARAGEQGAQGIKLVERLGVGQALDGVGPVCVAGGDVLAQPQLQAAGQVVGAQHAEEDAVELEADGVEAGFREKPA